MQKCFSCGIELKEDDIYEVKGKIFCDDCALGQHKLVQTCDPSAVLSAKLDRQRSGHTGTQGLTPVKKNFMNTSLPTTGSPFPSLSKNLV